MKLLSLKRIEFKLVLLGDSAVGKSSLTSKFVGGRFYDYREENIGASFSNKIIPLDEHTAVRFEIWDVSDHKRFDSLASMYYRNANCIIVVYDITRSASLEKARKWIRELRREGDPLRIIALCGNKADLSSRRHITGEEAKKYAKKEGLMWAEVSAKSGEGVPDLFDAITNKMLLTAPPAVRAHGGPGATAVLEKLPHADQAACEKAGSPGRLDSASEALLRNIMYWAAQGDKAVYWLKGGEGTGKTTIALTLSQNIRQDSNFLTASFVCVRNKSKRSDIQFIFTTLARQLAERDLHFRAQLVEAIIRMPDVGDAFPEEQFKRLIVEPLQFATSQSTKSQRSVMLIIDALDECKGRRATEKILYALTEHITSVPFLKVFVTSRSEPSLGALCDACSSGTE